MSLHNVSESDNFDTNVQMPADGDAADSSDFEASTIRPLVNRSRWLKNALAVLQVLVNGGTLTALDTVTWSIPNGKKLILTTPVSGSGELDLTSIYHMLVAQNIKGALFATGSSGRANRKPAIITPGAGTTDIDVQNYNTYFVTPSVSCSVRFATPLTPVDGEWVEVINTSSANSVQVLDPASAVPTGDVSPLRSAATYFRSAVYVYASGVWRMAGASPFAAP